MRKLILVLLFGISFGSVKAQQLAYKNSLRAAVEMAYANGTYQNPVARYSLLHDKALGTSRWLFEQGLSYLNSGYARERVPSIDYYYLGKRSERFSADFTMLFHVVNKNRHALRVGLGPSLAYQRNSQPGNDLLIELTPDRQRVERISYTRIYSDEFDAGINVRADYEFALTNQLAIGIRISQFGSLLGTDLGNTIGSLSTAGLTIGYRF